jgi:hypothetical protein
MGWLLLIPCYLKLLNAIQNHERLEISLFHERGSLLVAPVQIVELSVLKATATSLMAYVKSYFITWQTWPPSGRKHNYLIRKLLQSMLKHILYIKTEAKRVPLN